jgi:hypothetical protein
MRFVASDISPILEPAPKGRYYYASVKLRNGRQGRLLIDGRALVNSGVLWSRAARTEAIAAALTEVAAGQADATVRRRLAGEHDLLRINELRGPLPVPENALMG